MTDSNILANQKQFLGHPVGLYILFLTEMWERFSYYGMRAILVLYLVGEVGIENAGLGWSNEDALALYGWYTMFVYVASIPGGIIADKILGQKKSVFVGGMLLVAGHSVLAIEAMWAFYTGLTLIVMGVGMLKPNISTMVGGLYPKHEQDKRDLGFYIFYMGINLGAAASALIVGYIGETIGWHYGFGLAGIGMAFGQLTYWYGQRYLTHVGNLVIDERDESEKTDSNLISSIFKSNNSIVGFMITFALGMVIWLLNGSLNYGLLVMGLAFAVGVAIVVYNDGNKIEKDRILVTYLSFLIIIVFWGSFEQAGGLLNVYAKQKTDLLINGFLVPASWFQSVNAIFILIFATIVGSFWVWWKNRKRESSSLFKMAIGVIIMGWGFFFMSAASMQYEVEGLSSMHWLVLAYLFHTIGELCASPVALSFITKLAPDRWMAFMMGAYFAATGLGNKIAGLLGESATEIGEFKIFTGIAVFCTIFGLLVLLIIKPLKRLTHKAEESVA
jgi:POT family proton-dependent oligopeptide transporter